MNRIEKLLCMGFLTLVTACASAPIPYKQPVAVTPPSGNVAISSALNLLDASGSNELEFADGKATLESLVAAMPDGNYQAGNTVFGGSNRETTGVGPFDRAKLAASARNASFLGGTTPIFAVLEQDVTDAIGGEEGKAAIVLVSDGLATDHVGRGGVNDRTVEAAVALVEGRNGETCFHSVQVGNDPAGAELLQAVSGASSCGSFRNASSLGSASALQAFSREVYLAGAASAPAIPVAAAGIDTDGDGVPDAIDECPNTLRSARVDARGCWRIKDLEFAVNGTEIQSAFTSTLQEDIAVLSANPDVRVRIDGHTDSDGSAAYNQDLSERRAKAVRDHFVNEGGLDAGRFEIKGLGETQPAVENDSRENKRHNRRVELTILD